MTFIKVVLFAVVCVLCTQTEASLTSSLDVTGRRFACPGETVTYTCRLTGTLLAWSIPPNIPSNNPVSFFADGNSLGDSRVEGGVPVIITGFQTVSSNPTVVEFASVLSFDNTDSSVNATRVMCRNESIEDAQFVDYRLADPATYPTTNNPMCDVVPVASDSGSLITLELSFVTITWDIPVGINDFDFSSYRVDISSSDETISLNVPQNMTIVRLSTGSYNASISVVDRCGLIGEAVTIPVSVPTQPDVPFRGVAIGFGVFAGVVILAAVIFALVIVILYKRECLSISCK